MRRDIVDEEHCKGNFFKMLLGSINPLFDNDGDVDIPFMANGG